MRKTTRPTSAPATHGAAPSNGFQPSSYQLAIYQHITEGSGNAIVDAVAGSGKSTTLIHIAELIKGSHATFCAFNKAIADNLAERLGDMIECKTIHALAFAVCKRNGIRIYQKPDAKKYRDLADSYAVGLVEQLEEELSADEFAEVNPAEIQAAIEDMVDFCQLGLFEPEDSDRLQAAIDHYGLTEPAHVSLELLIAHARAVLDDGLKMAREQGHISFSDMLWLIWKLKMRVEKRDWLLVDEGQDLNDAQTYFLLQMCGPHTRVVVVGDPFQAIYGFAGANSASFWNLKAALNAKQFPLSVCYRCGTSIIERAQQIVPHIEAAPGKEAGEVIDILESELLDMAQPDDLVLCRLNAPLIGQCLKFIQAKIPARVKGREVGYSLVRLVRIVANEEGFAYERFARYLQAWVERQIAKYQESGNESAIESVIDKRDALLICWEWFDEAKDIGALCKAIESLFADNVKGVILSTVHKAKGLEADNVFILRPEKLPLVRPGQKDWEIEQEYNLLYVAITRAMKRLAFVYGEKHAERIICEKTGAPHLFDGDVCKGCDYVREPISVPSRALPAVAVDPRGRFADEASARPGDIAAAEVPLLAEARRPEASTARMALTPSTTAEAFVEDLLATVLRCVEHSGLRRLPDPESGVSVDIPHTLSQVLEFYKNESQEVA